MLPVEVDDKIVSIHFLKKRLEELLEHEEDKTGYLNCLLELIGTCCESYAQERCREMVEELKPQLIEIKERATILGIAKDYNFSMYELQAIDRIAAKYTNKEE